MATIDVMTFNLRMPLRNREPGDPDHWLTRMPAGIELLRSRRPAVVGTQEGCDPQWDRLLPELPHYQRLGTGRERGGSCGACGALPAARYAGLPPTPCHAAPSAR